jgi:outer membrane protein OmpA-like peptidoglycan-associated protein
MKEGEDTKFFYWSRTMSSLLKHSRISLISAAVGGLLLSTVGIAVAQNQPSAQTIMQALTPKPITRSLTVSPADTAKAAEEQKFIDTVRNRQTRSLSTSERETIATIAKEKPSIDLEIRFDYNSAAINATSQPGVKALGEALASPELKNSTFIIAGHTDSKGGDEYNQSLSEKRADAIKRYLVEKQGIAAANLVTVGYGETQLKNKDNSLAPENRRVQVVNMVKSAEAKN